MVLNILIVDDDKNDILKIQNKLASFFFQSEKYLIDGFDNSTSHSILEKEYSLYFLDIDMPNKDGFALATDIKSKYPNAIIIFVTNHDELVFHSFEIHPFFFVRKCSFESDMERGLQLFRKKYESMNKSFTFIYQGKEIRLPINDILYFEKYSNNLYIHAKNYTYKIRENISKIENQLLNEYFVRIHTNCLVNLKNVVEIDHNIVKLDNCSLEISRRRIGFVKEKYLEMLGDMYA